MRDCTFNTYDVTKKILFNYLVGFLFVFLVFFVNQVFLQINFFIEYSPTFTEILKLIILTIPSIIGLAIPYSVGIGLVLGLLSIDITGKIKKFPKSICIKKLYLPILCLNIFLVFVNFSIADFIMPNTNTAYNIFYNKISENEQNMISYVSSPRNMSSKMLIQSIQDIKNTGDTINERNLNLHRIELHKRISIPIGILFFSLVAFFLSLLIKNKKYSKSFGFIVSCIFCVIHWVSLLYAQQLSIKTGENIALAMWFPNIVLLCISIVLFLVYKKTARVHAGAS